MLGEHMSCIHNIVGNKCVIDVLCTSYTYSYVQATLIPLQ